MRRSPAPESPLPLACWRNSDGYLALDGRPCSDGFPSSARCGARARDPGRRSGAAQHGRLEGLTMEGVAAGAQTGKAAVYRRWPSKEDLVADALEAGLPRFEEVPDLGSVREDL